MSSVNIFDIISTLRHRRDFPEIFSFLKKYCFDLGFDYISFGSTSKLPLASPRITGYSNYSLNWQKAYTDQHYFSLDPTIKHRYINREILLWNPALFREQPQFWEHANSFGICEGLSLSSTSPNNTRYFCSLSRHQEPVISKELKDIRADLHHLIELCIFFLNKETPKEITEELTSREIEILRWTGDGKTSEEISHILNISTRTVHFHINNCLKKLNAANKTQAIVKALVNNKI